MRGVEFWRPRLSGPRFDDGEIPLQALGDLTALREMVIEVAKWRYLSENPERQKAPRGFTDQIDLKLASVVDGSAVPVITLTSTTQVFPGMDPPYQKFFTMAKDDIATAVAAVSENDHSPPSSHLPNKFLAYFNRIGRSLREDESLEFPASNGAVPAILTRETRRRLLEISAITEFSQEVILRGTIPEADQERMTFTLQQVDGGRVAGPMPEQHREAIIAAFNGYRDNARILVQGIGRYDRQGRLSGMEFLEQVTPLDPLDVPSRLDELRAMQDGWLEGAGAAPFRQGLDWLSASFERYFPDDLPLPRLYPTPEGAIEAEWSLGDYSIILEFNLDGHQGDWLLFAKLSDDNEEPRALNLDEDAEWDWLTKEIRRLSEESE